MALPFGSTVFNNPFPSLHITDHDWIGNRSQMHCQSTHGSGAWIEPGSHNAALLETLINASFDRYQYHITFMNPCISMSSFTILRRKALLCTSRFNLTVRAMPGLLYVSSSSHILLLIYCVVSYSKLGVCILALHYTHHFWHRRQYFLAMACSSLYTLKAFLYAKQRCSTSYPKPQFGLLKIRFCPTYLL